MLPYLPNGKIIFYTGWFKSNPGFTDAEVATILAHEVHKIIFLKLEAVISNSVDLQLYAWFVAFVLITYQVGHGLCRHASEVLIRALWLVALIILPLSKLKYVDRRAMGALVGAIVASFPEGTLQALKSCVFDLCQDLPEIAN